MAKRIRTRALALAELRRLVPDMDEYLSQIAAPARLQPMGRVWFGRQGQVSSCEVREQAAGFLVIRHTMRFR